MRLSWLTLAAIVSMAFTSMTGLSGCAEQPTADTATESVAETPSKPASMDAASHSDLGMESGSTLGGDLGSGDVLESGSTLGGDLGTGDAIEGSATTGDATKSAPATGEPIEGDSTTNDAPEGAATTGENP